MALSGLLIFILGAYLRFGGNVLLSIGIEKNERLKGVRI